MAESTLRETVPVTLSGDRHYDIVIQSGILDRLGEECRRWVENAASVLLVTDKNLARLYQSRAVDTLEKAGFKVVTHIVPAGEQSKSMAQLEAVYQTALEANLSRKDVIVGLGGGVVGDLSGFCASTWHRGTRLVHVPTSLVAQVDSAIGGKTAVNFGQVKNMAGTFYQPLGVLSDPALLETLPERELAAGLAEVVKYGLIEISCTGEPGLFDWLMDHSRGLKQVFPEMIRRCCAIKAAVVMQDETETLGLRHYLNLGHTFGHAYESLSNYSLLHGEAVAIGLYKAARLACNLGLFPDDAVKQLQALLRQFDLWASIQQSPCFSPQALLNRMRKDKKNLEGTIRLILPEQVPGRVIVRDDIADAEILKVLSSI